LKEQGLDSHGKTYNDEFIAVVIPLFRDRWTDRPGFHGPGIGVHQGEVDDIGTAPPRFSFQRSLLNPFMCMCWIIIKQLTLDPGLPVRSIRPPVIDDRWLSDPNSSYPSRFAQTICGLDDQAFHGRFYTIPKEGLHSIDGVSIDTSIEMGRQNRYENPYNSRCPGISEALPYNPRSLEYTGASNSHGIDGMDFLTQFIANIASAGFAVAVGATGQYLFHHRGQVYHTFNSVSDHLRRTWNTRRFGSSSNDNLRSRSTTGNSDETWEMVTMNGALGVDTTTMNTITGGSSTVADPETRANRTRQMRRNSL
jgi:hypothetical protein